MRILLACIAIMALAFPAQAAKLRNLTDDPQQVTVIDNEKEIKVTLEAGESRWFHSPSVDFVLGEKTVTFARYDEVYAIWQGNSGPFITIQRRNIFDTNR